MTYNKTQNIVKGFTHLNFSKKNLGGFTLVETMIAIAILLIAVVTPISLIGNALHNLYYARDQVVAVNLAQEGIEGVRQKRDSNLLAGVAWGNGLTAGSSYIFDATTLTLSQNADTKIYQNGSGQYFQGLGGTATPFTRAISITDISSTEKEITSVVNWKTGTTPGVITVTEYIYNWLP